MFCFIQNFFFCYSNSKNICGICGQGSEGSITNCINAGIVIGVFNTGGIFGWVNSTISNCINIGIMEGITNVHCIWGDGNTSPNINNCWWDKQLCPIDDD